MDTDESLKVGRSNCWKSWALDEERASKWGRNRREGKARTDKCFDSCYFHHFNTETHDPKASDCHSSGVSCSEGCFSLTPFPSLALLLSLSGRVCVCVCVCVRAHSERTKNFDARVRQSRPQAYKAHFPEILQYIYVNYRYIKISPARAVEKIYGKKAQHFSSNAVTYNSWNNLAARQSWIISLDTPASQKASAKREISLFLVYLVSCLRSWK